MRKCLLKKIVISAFTVLLFLGIGTVEAKAGTDKNSPEEIPVTYGETIRSAEAQSVAYTKTYSWKSGNGEDPAPQDYAKFTLPEKSFVKIFTSWTTDTSYALPTGENDVYIYSNPGYTTELGKTDFNIYMNSPVYLELDAGTYYVRTSVKSAHSFSYSFTGNIMVCAVKDKDGIQIQQKNGKNQKSVTVSFQAAGLEGVQSVRIWEGSAAGSWWGGTDVTDGKFVATKNGTYTAGIETGVGLKVYRTFKVTGVDTTKPTVKGVKNGKAYKQVTIKFSDKGSGIKKATLNGKTIKTGTKVGEKGKYTLKVWDKAGNLQVITFQIK